MVKKEISLAKHHGEKQFEETALIPLTLTAPLSTREMENEEKPLMDKWCSTLIGKFINIRYTMYVNIEHDQGNAGNAISNLEIPLKILRKPRE